MSRHITADNWVRATVAGLLLTLSSAVPAHAAWLAIANGGGEALGYAWGKSTGADAGNAARASCPSGDCRLVLVVEAACAAYARPKPEHGGQARGYWFSFGANQAEVVRQSLAWCAEGAGEEFICTSTPIGC
jgi:hypothetical protein